MYSTERPAAINSALSQRMPKIDGRSGRRNRSYSDAHVHFFSTTRAETTAFSSSNLNASYCDDSPTKTTEKEATSSSQYHQNPGNRPRSKSESEHCHHHRRVPHKKKYPHHHQQWNHPNYGRYSPPPNLSSSSFCGKMWVRPMTVRHNSCGIVTSSVLSSGGGSPSSHTNLPQVTANSKTANETEKAVSIDYCGSLIKSKSSSNESYTGLEDELMTMTYTSSPTSPPSFDSVNYSRAHQSPKTSISFGESGKPITRVKTLHLDDAFESGFLPNFPSQESASASSGVI